MSQALKRSSMALFSDSQCYQSHRVRIVLAEKGVGVEIIAVDPNNISAEIKELNPYGTLPTFVDREELCLYEPKVIMEYLDERFPHPPLMPVYPVARAKCRLWMYRLERDWYPLLDNLLNSKDTKLVEESRLRLTQSLTSIAPIFADKPFFMSDEFTMMDCSLAPLLWRLKKVAIVFPENPKTRPLHEYMERLFSRTAFKESLTDEERDMAH